MTKKRTERKEKSQKRLLGITSLRVRYLHNVPAVSRKAREKKVFWRRMWSGKGKTEEKSRRLKTEEKIIRFSF